LNIILPEFYHRGSLLQTKYLHLRCCRNICPLEQAADVNGTGGEPDISDITALISFLYLSGPDPKC